MRLRLPVLVIAEAATLVGAACPATAATLRSYNIPAQAADAALREFARQSGQQILFPYDLVAGKAAPPLVGLYAIRAGLERLTAGLGLVVVSDDGRTLGLAPAPVPTARGGRFPEATAPLAVRQARPSPATGREAVAPLDEIVVTATHTPDKIYRVPLSLTALSQTSLDLQNVKSAQDLATVTPALRITADATNGASVSIRGIASTGGAATTGVYLDDTPLHKRAGLGAVNGFGVVFPQIFDLERIEVIRGPQGTLYGASSEGGTVRFITPAPSLTETSLALKAEVSTTEGGAPSYEAGAAGGGPLATGRLGYRLSIWGRHSGGYIDHVSRFTGRTLAKETNSADTYALRLSTAWKPVERMTITPAVYFAYAHQADVDTYWLDVPAYTQAPRYFTATGAPTTETSPTRAFAYPVNANPAYPMYGAYRSGVNACAYAVALVSADADQCPVLQPRINGLAVGSLTVDLSFHAFDLKVITSVLEDRNRGLQYMGANSLGTANAGDQFVFDLPYVVSNFGYATRRDLVSHEVRLVSRDREARLQWTAGAFFSAADSRSVARASENTDDFYRVLRGVPQEVITGGALVPGDPLLQSERSQRNQEREAALFGEATLGLTAKLRATLGARLSRTEFTFDQVTFGPTFGYNTPTGANGGLTSGSIVETPVTPKLGLSYHFNGSEMVYVTATKGFRVGGVNSPPAVGRCSADLATLGVAKTPETFGADSVWSYEVGAKLRLADRGQLSGSLFRIDWRAPQTQFLLPTCGFSFTINAGAARSQGFDLEGRLRIIRGLNLLLQMAYTDARYTRNVSGGGAGGARILSAGDPLAAAPWATGIAIQYDRALAADLAAYARADFHASSGYRSGRAYPSLSYNPELARTDGTQILNLRAGLSGQAWELAVFASNVTGSTDALSKAGGRTGCASAACEVFRAYNQVTTVGTFRPRTFGVSLKRRY